MVLQSPAKDLIAEFGIEADVLHSRNLIAIRQGVVRRILGFEALCAAQRVLCEVAEPT